MPQINKNDKNTETEKNNICIKDKKKFPAPISGLSSSAQFQIFIKLFAPNFNSSKEH